MSRLPTAAALAAAAAVTLTLSPLALTSLQPGAGAAQTPPTAAARADIPAALLPHYQRAPACTGLPWQVIAAIGAVESDHAHLDITTGEVTPPIVGPALNGHGYAAVPVPAGGSRWHHDPVWDHAVGPMQFLTATWTRWGVDASGDGLASPHNAYDAIATAGRFLCNGQRRLDSVSDAVRRYNNSDSYLTRVLTIARRYGMTDGGEPPPPSPGPVDPAGGPVLHGPAEPVVAFAVAQLGKPYVWGAAGPDGYDCSGLTMAAYAVIGVQLPHYAAYQARYGQPIDWHRQPIRPGDLLFLRGGDPIHDDGHVGIAINPAEWIDAPQAGQPVTRAPIPYPDLQAVRRLLLP